MPNSRPKRAKTSVDIEEPSPTRLKQRRHQQSRSPSPSNGSSSPRQSTSPRHPKALTQISNGSEDEDGSSIDIVGLDPNSSSASLQEDGPPKRITTSKNSKNLKAQTNGVKHPPKADPVLYCLVQHPIASATPIPSAAASTCYKCNKKLVVVSQYRYPSFLLEQVGAEAFLCSLGREQCRASLASFVPTAAETIHILAAGKTLIE
jgi:hypothetical protein